MSLQYLGSSLLALARYNLSGPATFKHNPHRLALPCLAHSPYPVLALSLLGVAANITIATNKRHKQIRRPSNPFPLHLPSLNSNTTHQPRCFLSMKPRDFTPTHLLKGHKLSAKIRNTSSPLLSSSPVGSFRTDKGRLNAVCLGIAPRRTPRI